jgi:hypothetical protein
MPINRPYIWISPVLFLLTTGIFLRSISYGFITFDDPLYVTDNPLVLSGLSLETIREAFITDRGGFWIPLTWLSLALDRSLFGMNSWGFHITNILLHAANTVLLFIVLRRMTGAVWPATFVAAGFAIHPLHVESVVWVTERKDVLYGLFWMLGLLAYKCYTQKPSLTRYVPLAGALACTNLANAFVAYWKYLGITVWLSELSVYYPYSGYLFPQWQPLTSFWPWSLCLLRPSCPSEPSPIFLWDGSGFWKLWSRLLSSQSN